jgi:hypothetical protein
MIQINEKVRIVRLDKLNLQLEEYRKVVNKKEERYEWCWVGYYGDLRSAIAGVLKHCSMALVDEEINGCNAVLQRLDEIGTELRNAVSVANTIVY